MGCNSHKDLHLLFLVQAKLMSGAEVILDDLQTGKEVLSGS